MSCVLEAPVELGWPREVRTMSVHVSRIVAQPDPLKQEIFPKKQASALANEAHQRC